MAVRAAVWLDRLRAQYMCVFRHTLLSSCCLVKLDRTDCANWIQASTGAQVEKGWGRCAPQGRWGPKADVGNPGGRHGR